jgi:hypothetical protein
MFASSMRPYLPKQVLTLYHICTRYFASLHLGAAALNNRSELKAEESDGR